MGGHRALKRVLVRWNDDHDKELLVWIIHCCTEAGMRIPFETVAKGLGANFTEGAIIQHLAKLRNKMADVGLNVPPPLKRCVIAKAPSMIYAPKPKYPNPFGDAPETPSKPAKTLTPASAPQRGVKRKAKTKRYVYTDDEVEEVDVYEGDSDEEFEDKSPSPQKARKISHKAAAAKAWIGRKNRRVIKEEDVDDIAVSATTAPGWDFGTINERHAAPAGPDSGRQSNVRKPRAGAKASEDGPAARTRGIRRSYVIGGEVEEVDADHEQSDDNAETVHPEEEAEDFDNDADNQQYTSVPTQIIHPMALMPGTPIYASPDIANHDQDLDSAYAMPMYYPVGHNMALPSPQFQDPWKSGVVPSHLYVGNYGGPHLSYQGMPIGNPLPGVAILHQGVEGIAQSRLMSRNDSLTSGMTNLAVDSTLSQAHEVSIEMPAIMTHTHQPQHDNHFHQQAVDGDVPGLLGSPNFNFGELVDKSYVVDEGKRTWHAREQANDMTAEHREPVGGNYDQILEAYTQDVK